MGRARSNGGHPLLPQKAALGSTSDQGVVQQFAREGTSSKEEHSTGQVEELEVHITQQPGTIL